MTELMVSLSLSAVVVLAGLSLSAVYTATVTDQISTSGMNENMWGAAEMVAREVRKAGQGFAMCPEGRIQVWRSASTYSSNPPYATPPVVVTNNRFCKAGAPCTNPTTDFISGPGTDGPDMIHIFYGDGGKPTGAAGSTANPGLSLGGDTKLTGAWYQNDGVFRVNSVAGFAVNDYFVAWSSYDTTTRCALFKTTAIDTVAKTISALGSNPQNATTSPSGHPAAFLSGAVYKGTGAPLTPATLTRLGQWRKVTFFIRDPQGPRPVLMMDRHDRDTNHDGAFDLDGNGDPLPNPIPVAEGVEDLQIAVACDRNADNDAMFEAPFTAPLVEKQNDDFYPNVVGDLRGNACYDAFGTSTVRPPIAAVRLSVVTRTDSDGGVAIPFKRPPLEDRAGPPNGAPPKEGGVGYKRRVQTVLVSLRNLY